MHSLPSSCVNYIGWYICAVHLILSASYVAMKTNLSVLLGTLLKLQRLPLSEQVLLLAQQCCVTAHLALA